MVRYYLPQNIFFHGEFGLGSSKSKNEPNNAESKSSVFSWGVATGYALFLNNNVAIEPMLGYGATSYKDKDTKDKDINNGFFIQVGFQVYLGDK